MLAVFGSLFNAEGFKLFNSDIVFIVSGLKVLFFHIQDVGLVFFCHFMDGSVFVVLDKSFIPIDQDNRVVQVHVRITNPNFFPVC